MKEKFNKTYAIAKDHTVNRMGFGAMRITGKGIWGPPADTNEAITVLKTAIDLGVNFIDTADSYGPNISEELIAKALYPYPADLLIGTKGGLTRKGPDIWIPDGSPAHLAAALDGSLERLKVEQIGLYQLHRIDPNVPQAETFMFLQKAQQEGKIKHIGLSEVNVETIKRAREFFEVASVQNMYSVDNRKWESVLEYTIATNIAFIPWYPLNAGKVRTLETLQKVANKHGASVQQIALSWLLHHSNNILLIPGTSNVGHLKENIKTLHVELTQEDMLQLDKKL